MINQVRSGVGNVQVKNKPSQHTDKQAQTCCPGVSYMQDIWYFPSCSCSQADGVKTNIQPRITTSINIMCKNEFSHLCFQQGWNTWDKKTPRGFLYEGMGSV